MSTSTAGSALRSEQQLTVMIMGLRGFPGVQGGVETHIEHLSPLLVKLGCKVEVLTRKNYQPETCTSFKGVEIKRLWAPRSRSLETLLHSLLCIVWAGIRRPDILHIQAIGPAIVTPLARLLGLTVVVTHHGPDYDRQKWGGLGKTILRAGEWFGMRLSHNRIAISPVIVDLIRSKHGSQAKLIPNGVVIPETVQTCQTLKKWGLAPGRYVLLVSRLVPEKRHLDLIKAFKMARIPGWKLCLVGSSDHPDDYSRQVLAEAASNEDIVAAGFQTGDALKELYAHAGMFVLPSSHEGLPISLLEAMSFNLKVLASNIPANMAVQLPGECYFELGNVVQLSERMKGLTLEQVRPDQPSMRELVAAKYDWESVARQTRQAYLEALN